MPTVTIQHAFALAVQHHQAGRLGEAEGIYRQILAGDPRQPDTLHMLGVLAHQLGRNDLAVDLIGQAMAILPEHPAFRSNLSEAHRALGQTTEAIAASREALRLKPDYPEALNNLGNALLQAGRPDEAIVEFRKAIELNPSSAETYHNLGAALQETWQLDGAVAAFRRAITLKHHYPEAQSALILALNCHPSGDARAIAEEQSRWNQQYAEPLRHLIQPPTNERSVARRLRIGYVSADFREHPVGCNLLPLLAGHDPHGFEIFGYAGVARPDPLTERFRASAHHWRSTVGISDELLAAQIREDRIDILVDLAVHTANHRLLVFARKPAPVQVTFAGYPGSTGLTAIDYRLSDPFLDPPGMDESIYAEKTVRLPHSFWCYDPLDGRETPVNNLPAQSNGYLTFGCLNNFCKTNPASVRLWARILCAVPCSRLLLLAPEGSHRQRVTELFGKEGVGAERLEFVSHQPRRKYLELYHRIDLGLDTLPYNGHTTSLDSFWMGVPVVNLVGKTIVGRAGFCQLTNLKLPELIASTPEDYVQIATALAEDLSRLAALRSTLRPRMEKSPLMDASRFARDIEAAYREMWRQWCAKAP